PHKLAQREGENAVRRLLSPYTELLLPCPIPPPATHVGTPTLMTLPIDFGLGLGFALPNPSHDGTHHATRAQPSWVAIVRRLKVEGSVRSGRCFFCGHFLGSHFFGRHLLGRNLGCNYLLGNYFFSNGFLGWGFDCRRLGGC